MTDKSAPEQVELLPCEVCGSAAELGYHCGVRYVECQNDECGHQGGMAWTDEEAIAAWNHRIQSQRPSPGVDVDLVERVARRIEADLCAEAKRSVGSIWADERGRGQTLIAAKAAITSMPDERKLIVDWLRARSPHEYFHANSLADRIERGDHISAAVEG